MNKLSRIASIVITLNMVGTAYAELNHWTGLYAGVDAGLAFNDAQLKSQQLGFTNPSNTCNNSSDFSTAFPGVQLGYLHQFPNDVVSGIEASITLNTNQTQSLSCTCPINPDVSDHFSFRNQMQTSIKGRVGHTLNWQQYILLPYLTAGASVANVGLTYKNEGGDYYADNTTQTGWLIGAGIEWAFWQHWSVRAEYYYADYGNAINLNIPNIYGLHDANGHARVDLSSNNLVVAINYWM